MTIIVYQCVFHNYSGAHIDIRLLSYISTNIFINIFNFKYIT